MKFNNFRDYYLVGKGQQIRPWIDPPPPERKCSFSIYGFPAKGHRFPGFLNFRKKIN